MNFKCTCGADRDVCVDCMQDFIEKVMIAIEKVHGKGLTIKHSDAYELGSEEVNLIEAPEETRYRHIWRQDKDRLIVWTKTEKLRISVLSIVGTKSILVFKHEIDNLSVREMEKFIWKRLSYENIDSCEWTWITHETISRLL